MKKIFILMAMLLSWLGNAQCITNGGFEALDLNDYDFSRTNGNFDILDCDENTGGYDIFTPNTTNNFAQSATMVTLGSDPTISALSRVHSGNRAVKLNNTGSGGGDRTCMSTFIEPTSTTISFFFALIVQNPHPDEPLTQPFFRVRVYDENNELVENTQICIMADANNPIFKSVGGGAVLYTEWVCSRINIPDELLAQELRLEFLVADCGQGAHFGTVYIDDISCEPCNDPAFGFIELDSDGYSCPTEPFDVCGTYFTPHEGALDSTILEILLDGNVVETINTTSSLTAETFCFEVDPAILYSDNEYEIRVIADFEIDGVTTNFITTLTDISSVTGSDISFSGVDISLAATVGDGDILFWEDISSSYDLEFFLVGNPSISYSTTTTVNFIDLLDVSANMGLTFGSRMFKWRIRAENCEWSEWCTLYYFFPRDYDGTYWVNPYAPYCDDGECEEYYYATVLVPDGTSELKKREIAIFATNVIETGARTIYQAGNYIELNPGFYSQTGAYFLAIIDECEPLQSLPQRKPTTESHSSLKPTRGVAENLPTVTVYPNPTNGLITVTGLGASEFIVTDITGKQLMTIPNDSQAASTDIDLSGLNAGIYFLSADGKTIQKIIKN